MKMQLEQKNTALFHFSEKKPLTGTFFGDMVIGMTRETQVYLFPRTPQRELLRDLDLELLFCGYDSGKTDLETIHPFRMDPYFRLHSPVEGHVKVAGCDGATVLESGRLYLFPANVPFRFLSQGGFTHYWLHFRSRFLEKQPAFRQLISAEAPPGIANWWAEFFEYARRQQTLADIMKADLLLRELLTGFLEKIDADRMPGLETLERFQPVLDYIDQNFRRELTTEELASLLRTNHNTFSREFRRAFGTPPKQYVVRRRMEHAKYLLLTSTATIKEIAADCGYSNEYFFYRLFRKYNGSPPSEYRRNYRLG